LFGLIDGFLQTFPALKNLLAFLGLVPEVRRGDLFFQRV
jgi:hypothetical protein